jgi:hypothetical protein
MKVYMSQQSTYIAGGQQMQFTLSSGATYVDFLNSFLKFTIRMPPLIVDAVNPKMSPHCGCVNRISADPSRSLIRSGVGLDQGECRRVDPEERCAKNKK